MKLSPGFFSRAVRAVVSVSTFRKSSHCWILQELHWNSRSDDVFCKNIHRWPALQKAVEKEKVEQESKKLVPEEKGRKSRFIDSKMKLPINTTTRQEDFDYTPQKELTREDQKREAREKYTVNTFALQAKFFDSQETKDKETFHKAIDLFTARDNKYRRGHCEFIYAALRVLKEFGVHRDRETYRSLINIFPKGPFIPTNMWQVEYYHFPKQQDCAIEVLCEMEENGVVPDSKFEHLIADIFGCLSFPSRRLARMMYWMPKFLNLSPWTLPDVLPGDALSLVKLAIRRITSVDLQTAITIFQTEDLDEAKDHTWIVSGQSPKQQELIESHPADRPIYVEGAFRVWLRNHCINYFILRSEPHDLPKDKVDPDDVSDVRTIFSEDITSVIAKPSVHEQEDGNILAVCGTGTSSKDSLISWMRLLQDSNPRLGQDISVIFSLKSPVGPTDNLERLRLSPKEREAQAKLDTERGYAPSGPGLDPENPHVTQWGITKYSETKFVNWPHDYNASPVEAEDERTEEIEASPEMLEFQPNSNSGGKNKHKPL